MRNGTLKYPDNRFGGHLSKRIPKPSETKFSDNSVTYGFNDFMTQCRHSLLICYIISALNLMGVNQPICVITETEDAVHMETKNLNHQLLIQKNNGNRINRKKDL